MWKGKALQVQKEGMMQGGNGHGMGGRLMMRSWEGCEHGHMVDVRAYGHGHMANGCMSVWDWVDWGY